MKRDIKNINLPGQMSIWDIAENLKKITVNKVLKIKNQDNKMEVLIKNKLLELTKEQQKFLNQNNVMENKNLYRIIKYSSCGLGIEIKKDNKFKTIYVNRKGKKEFEIDKKSSVLPKDKILYYKENLKVNKIQEEKLKQLKKEYSTLKEIRRKGDENIIVELKNKLISINSKGWILEFKEYKAIYTQDEVVKKHKRIETIKSNIKVGDIVEAVIRNKVVQGKIIRMYGMGNTILNIVFDNNTKHTAVGKYAIKRVIKCA